MATVQERGAGMLRGPDAGIEGVREEEPALRPMMMTPGIMGSPWRRTSTEGSQRRTSRPPFRPYLRSAACATSTAGGGAGVRGLERGPCSAELSWPTDGNPRLESSMSVTLKISMDPQPSPNLRSIGARTGRLGLAAPSPRKGGCWLGFLVVPPQGAALRRARCTPCSSR